MAYPLRFTIAAIAFGFVLTVLCCEGKAQDENKPAAGQQQSTIRFKTFSYEDKDGIGSEAFRLLMPADWKFSGGIQWVLDNPGMPAIAKFTIANPSGSEELEVFPNQPFFWTDNQMALSLFPRGSKYFGNEVREPIGIKETLKSIILPRFRQNVQNLKVVETKELPDLAKSLGAAQQSIPGVTGSSEGAKIRIEYTKNGKEMQEEIFGVVEKVEYSFQTMNGRVTNINWVADYLFSFKAEKGKLDSQYKMFQTIVESFKLNPQWFNKYNQVVEYLIQQQIQQIRNVGELSKIISRTHNEISDMIMDSYNKRQAVYDKISTNFSQYIRGVDEYANPFEQKPVELPSGYRHAWVNRLGEYVLSDDPNFNPNVESNKEWAEMKRK